MRQAGTWDSAAMLAPGHTLPQATKKPHEAKITARICSRCRFWTKETKRPKNPTATSEEPQAKAGYGTSPLHTIPPKGWENIYATHPAQKVKNLPANAGDRASVPGSGRCPGEGNGYLLQYACLENSTDRGAWQATVHEIAKESDTTERINNNHNIYASYPESSFSPGLFFRQSYTVNLLKLAEESSFSSMLH